MPESLTAENGAKQLLLGEFYESITLQCNECNGLGYDDHLMPCDACDGSGEYSQRVPIEWTTIKEIYAMAVKELANNDILNVQIELFH